MRIPNVRRATALSAAALALSLALAACSKKSEPAAAPTKPSQDYAAEAKSSINDANRDAELQKLKSEIEADK